MFLLPPYVCRIIISDFVEMLLLLIFLLSLLTALLIAILFQVKEVAPAARRRDARLSFAFVYPDKSGRFVVREVSLSLLSHFFLLGLRSI